MQLTRRMLYNASLISLIRELYQNYPHPIVIYDNSADDIDIYQTVAALNSPWISKTLAHDGSGNDQRSSECNSLHIFLVENVLDSVYLIRDHILRTSNSYRIQNIIFFDDLEPPLLVHIFEEHERFHRNTILCQRRSKIITCWYWTQQIDRINSTLTDLFHEPINLNLSVIQIKANLSPPNGFTPCFSGRFIFTGANSMVAAEILSKLNATPRYCSEHVVRKLKTGFCNFTEKFSEDEASKLLRRLKYDRKSQENIFHFLYDSRMIRYLYLGRGECKTPPDLSMDIGPMDENSNMTALVPTELSCISVIVPRASAASSFLRRTFYESVESIAFYCTVLLFTIARILISKCPFTQWFDILYSTFVIHLNQTTLKPKTDAEHNPSSKPIQTVKDLAASKYEILALNNAGNWMEHLRDEIREKISVVHYTVIIDQILKLNNTAALAVNDNVLGIVKPTWDSMNLDSNFVDDYYLMLEKLHCGHFSYRISDDLALDNDINRILHHMVEHGFITAYKKWSIHLMRMLNLFLKLTKEERSPVNFGSSHGIYYVWFGGILLSVVVFLCELLYKCVQRIN